MGIKRLLMVLSLAMGIPSAYAQNSAGVGDIGSSDGGDEILYIPLEAIGYEFFCNNPGANSGRGWSQSMLIRYRTANSKRIKNHEFSFQSYRDCQEAIRRIKIGELAHLGGKMRLTVTPEGIVKEAAVVSKDEGNDLKEGHVTASCKFMDDGLMAPVGLEGFGCRTDLSARALSCETEHGVPFAATGICSRGQSAIDCFNGTQTTQNGQSSTQQKGAQ